MLVILPISLFILSCTLLLHYYRHFKLVICAKLPPILSTNRNSSTRSSLKVSKDQLPGQCALTRPYWCRCCCSLAPIEESETYNFFPTSFLCFIILQIAICALLLCLDTITEHHHILSLFTHHPSWRAIGSSFHSSASDLSFVIASDYILMHSVMIVSIWESLFPFYKFYTTYKVVSNMQTVSPKHVMIRFMMYAFLFALLFNVQIHIYYYLWPILLLVHAVFNVVCTIKFSSVLIDKYQLVLGMDDRITSSDNDNILRSVYLMRAISIICSVLQTAALAVFAISYSVGIVYYLPMFWSLSTFIYSFSFVRNRTYFILKVFQCTQAIKYRSVFANKTSTSDDGPCVEVIVMPPPISTITCAKFSDLTVASTTKSVISSTVSKEPSAPRVRFATQIHTMTFEPDEPDAGARTTDKALHILGIQSQSSSIKRTPRPRLNPISKSRSDIIASPTCISPVTLKSPSSQSDITPGNHIGTARESATEDLEESATEASRSYFPHVPSRRVSSPFVNGMSPTEVNAFCNAKHSIDVDAIEYIDDEDDEFVNAFEDDSHGQEAMPPIPTLSLKHHKSNSNPVVINDILQNVHMVQVMGTLDLFAEYGFCSRNNINSLYQLARYKNRIHVQDTR
eukprot:6739_1